VALRLPSLSSRFISCFCIVLSLIACHAGVSSAWAGTSAAIDASNTPGVTPGQSNLNVGSQAVGSPSATQALTFTIGAGTTVGNIAVVTQGAPNLDFTSATGSTCTATTYSSDTNCTVKVTFKPRAPGPRYGGVVFTDGSGNLLANVYLQGTGVGPQIAFANFISGSYLPGTETILTREIGGAPHVAVDASGNVFASDDGNGAVKEIVAVNGSIPLSPTIRTLGSGFIYPNGIAVDGAGNVFVADRGTHAVKEIVAASGYTTVKTIGSGFNLPNGVAVDGSGNVFVADWQNNAVYEVLATGGYTTVKRLPSAPGNADYVAVDGSGNVFLANFDSHVYEILAAGGYTILKTLSASIPGANLCGIAVDGIGNVYVYDYLSGRHVVYEILAAGGYTSVITLASTTGTPGGIAVDERGNIILGHWYQGDDRILKLNYADPPSLTFSKTSVGVESSDSPQTVTVSNNGNADLTFPVPAAGDNPSISSDFTLDAATTCPNLSAGSTAAKLASGASCVYAVDFIPSAPDDYAGSLTLTDNSLNATAPAYARQTISLSGTSLFPPLGWIDQAVDSDTGSTTVGQSNALAVRGWVADPEDGAPMSNVTIYLDGTSIGKPTLGLRRADVAATYGNVYLNSGFQLLYPAASLSIGAHQVKAVAVDSGGRSTTLAPLTFTVAAVAGPGPPFGGIDWAVDSLSNSATVGQSDSLKVLGWFADRQDGAPLTNVTVLLDGVSIGKPTLGIARPDVAAAYGNAYLNSGFQLLYPAASLSLGAHQVQAIAVDSAGRSTTLVPRFFMVAAGAGTPFGNLDLAVDSVTSVATVSQSHSLKVLGWVADPIDGAPMSNVTVYIDGISIGKPTLGIARHDVAAAIKINAYLHSGFQLLYPASSLSLGAHQVTVVATDSVGQSTTFGPVTINVVQ
jgi:hypothetical protein